MPSALEYIGYRVDLRYFQHFQFHFLSTGTFNFVDWKIKVFKSSCFKSPCSAFIKTEWVSLLALMTNVMPLIQHACLKWGATFGSVGGTAVWDRHQQWHQHLVDLSINSSDSVTDCSLWEATRTAWSAAASYNAAASQILSTIVMWNSERGVNNCFQYSCILVSLVVF